MLVLHCSVLSDEGTYPDFAFWAETAQHRRSVAAATGKARPHPFALRAAPLRDLVIRLGLHDPGVESRSSTLIACLPSLDEAPLPSPALGESPSIPADTSPEIAPWRVECLLLDGVYATSTLLDLAALELPADVALGDDIRYWIVAARFAVSLARRQRFLPTLREEGGRFLARWQVLLDQAEDARHAAQLARHMPSACRALTRKQDAPLLGSDTALRAYLDCAVDDLARSAIHEQPPALPRNVRRLHGPSLGDRWLLALYGDPAVEGTPRELAALAQQCRRWAATETPLDGAESFRLSFRLDPPPPSFDEWDEGDAPAPAPGASTAPTRSATTAALRRASTKAPALMAADEPRWTLQFLLQAVDDPSLLVPVTDVWRERGASGRFLNRRFDHPQERVLAGLGQAARLFPPIESGLQVSRPESCALSTAEAFDFLREKALLLQAAGFGVLVPGIKQGLSLRLTLGSKKAAKSEGPAMFGWDTLVEYDWQLALGEQPLTREEFEALANLKAPLVQVRGQWVELRPEQVGQALAFFDRQARDGMGLAEALTVALAPDGDLGLPVSHVEAAGAFQELLTTIGGSGAARPALAEPPGFVGRLRPYQGAGLSWLDTLAAHGLGACLADDMGLGKTIQLIALLLQRRHAGQATAPALLICPTSVVGNWRRELARFAPSLRVLVHHGAGREKERFAEEATAHDVVISTYSLLPRDAEALGSVEWDEVILDEAQNIKNAATKAAQAARGLPARWRVALTGTPVENRLGELWSIFHFLNPGYLGSAERFRGRFASPIERTADPAATARLKALVSPFMLRRLKTDKAIIQDLPEKNEMKVFCTLTREQATLYEAVLKDAMGQIEEAEGIERRGEILAVLTRLKQVCNHPALFLHDGSALGERSGKLARLGEMLDEVVAVGDRALIFTQYAEMGKLLKAHLEERFGREVLFLSGSTAAVERDRMVTRFQQDAHGPQIFILSIKAGGTGLNLTRANHVFHFDRWWNPAVENQATDRAFRIGQRRDVQVHKYICAGTFEERLDAIIERKQALSEAIVGAGEHWITEMSNDELRDLLALRRDAVEEA